METILSNTGFPSVIKYKKADPGFHKTLMNFNLLLPKTWIMVRNTKC